MMKKKSCLALMMAMVLCCMGLLAGCDDSSSSSADDEDSSSTSSITSSTADIYDSDDDDAETNDVIGSVTYAGSSYLSVSVYTSSEVIEDYTAVDVADLTEGSSTEYIYIDDDTEYYAVESGALVSAAIDDITEGTIVAETESDSGTQQIIILGTSSSETASSDSE